MENTLCKLTPSLTDSHTPNLEMLKRLGNVLSELLDFPCMIWSTFPFPKILFFLSDITSLHSSVNIVKINIILCRNIAKSKKTLKNYTDEPPYCTN